LNRDPPKREATPDPAGPRDAAPDSARQNLRNPAGLHTKAHAAQLDRYVASCAITENENEIKLAKLAQQRATNPDVKAFAEMMVKDHTAFLEKLRPFDTARQGGVRGTEGANPATRDDAAPADRSPIRQPEVSRGQIDQPGSSRVGPRDDRSADNRTTDNRTDRSGSQQTGMAWGNSIPVQTLIQVKDEIAQKCLASDQRELQQKEGADFDRCYMGAQVGAHMKMADALSVLQNHVSADFQQVLSQGGETAQQHLTQAKKLFEQLDKSSAPKTARRNTSQDNAQTK
jgi:predicted outer membrane protein